MSVPISLHEALYCEKLDKNLVICHLCPNECRIQDGKHGSCGVRVNRQGILYSEVYGKATGIHLDPIEKKPLYRYHPGENILSIGTKGCNFHCDFCQNFHISQEPGSPTFSITSETIVNRAKEERSFGIAYTYNEPFIWYEFVLDTAKLARKNGLKNVLVTNGYVNREPLEEMLPFIDAMNIDVKSFDENFYINICKGRVKPVLETVKIAAKKCHVELTNLIIPTLNDSDEAIRKMVSWICDNTPPNTPLHLSRYFPCYNMALPVTPIETMKRAEKIAKERLTYVYLGNV